MLKEAKVRAAKPRPKLYKLTDSHRLYLLVTRNGSKLWKWNYAYDGKQKTMAFGIHPIVGLRDAKAKRDEAPALLESGKDPFVVRKLTVQTNVEASHNTFERVGQGRRALVVDLLAGDDGDRLRRFARGQVEFGRGGDAVGAVAVDDDSFVVLFAIVRLVGAAFLRRSVCGGHLESGNCATSVKSRLFSQPTMSVSPERTHTCALRSPFCILTP